LVNNPHPKDLSNEAKMKKLILITTLSSIAFSNPQPTIECKNGVLDTLSMAKVTDSMSEEKKKEFSDAYMALVFSRFDFDKSEEVLELELCQIMSGRTAIEIIEIASQIPDEQNEIIFGKFLKGRGQGGGSGVDSATDGVAVGLGIITGFCFLSSTLLLISLKDDE
jgi:hypothetical protein